MSTGTNIPGNEPWNATTEPNSLITSQEPPKDRSVPDGAAAGALRAIKPEPLVCIHAVRSRVKGRAAQNTNRIS